MVCESGLSQLVNGLNSSIQPQSKHIFRSICSSLSFVFQAMSFIHCDHRPTNRIKMGHVYHCNSGEVNRTWNLMPVPLRFRFSKRVKLVLSNLWSRRSVACIENNIHFRKPSNKFSYPCGDYAQSTTTRHGPRNGPGTCRSYNIQPRNEIVRNVFPRPISSARMTFLLMDHEKAS
jgi:hypothetical protein